MLMKAASQMMVATIKYVTQIGDTENESNMWELFGIIMQKM